VIRTRPKTAEMIKYTANSLLATMISFSNEIAGLCTALGGIDVVEVMRGVHLDKRLSPILADGQRISPAFTTFLEAGCGFGGSCFPKDVEALIAHGKRQGNPMQLLDAVMRINRRQPQKILELLEKYFPSLEGRQVTVLGLAFKPGTDDMRESPAIPVIRSLIERGAAVSAYDPVAVNEARKIFGERGIQYCDTLEAALEAVEAVVLMTRWPEFERLPELLEGLETQPLVIDGRRMLDKRHLARYDGIGL
jgi:UDPglucose 6-dehydrogenase